MKSASEWAGLLRLVLYDVIGLEIPGILFLAILYEYAAIANFIPAVRSLVAFEHGYQLAGFLIAAYLSGYVLQAITYLHLLPLRPIARFLLGKPEPTTKSEDPAAGMAARFAGSYFESHPFYTEARKKVGTKAGMEQPDKLTYSDTENLAFGLAGDEAQLAQQFRFRADLVGSISTLAMIHFLALVPLWSVQQPVPRLWWSVPLAVLAWWCALMLPDNRWPGKRLKWLKGRFWWVLPVIILAWLIVVRCITSQAPGSPSPWVIGLLLLVWFACMYRAFFYYDIGSRVVFYVAVASMAKAGSAGEVGQSPILIKLADGPGGS